MRKLIATLGMIFLMLGVGDSKNVLAGSPFESINQKLDQIQNTLDNQVVPKIDQCCGKIRVPRTGQTNSFVPGDDGALQMGVPWPDPRFTDHGDGTVTDNLTGLLWSQDSQLLSANRDWYDALGACSNLCFAGYDDWRLPNINELLSLIDWGSHPHLPPDNPFVNVWGEYYWSSTSSDSDAAVTVSVLSASIVRVGKTYALGKYVWCIRDGK